MGKGTALLATVLFVIAAVPSGAAGSVPVGGMNLSQPADARGLQVQLSGRPEAAPDPPRMALSAAKDFEEAPAPKGDAGPLLVGRSRRDAVLGLPKSVRSIRLEEHGDGHIGHLSITSPGARALRVALRIDEVIAGMEIRVAGGTKAKAGTAAFRYPLREAGFVGQRAVEIWTPTTSGESQLVEVMVPLGARVPTVTVENLSHLFVDPAEAAPSSARGAEKVLSCHVNFTCVTDPVIVQAGASVARLAITVATGET